MFVCFPHVCRFPAFDYQYCTKACVSILVEHHQHRPSFIRQMIVQKMTIVSTCYRPGQFADSIPEVFPFADIIPVWHLQIVSQDPRTSRLPCWILFVLEHIEVPLSATIALLYSLRLVPLLLVFYKQICLQRRNTRYKLGKAKPYVNNFVDHHTLTWIITVFWLGEGTNSYSKMSFCSSNLPGATNNTETEVREKGRGAQEFEAQISPDFLDFQVSREFAANLQNVFAWLDKWFFLSLQQSCFFAYLVNVYTHVES